jgi:hypothetical protein
MIIGAEEAVTQGQPGFKIICADCGSLSIQVKDPANSPATTPVLCGCCGAVRGTLGELHDLARLGTDSFEF